MSIFDTSRIQNLRTNSDYPTISLNSETKESSNDKTFTFDGKTFNFYESAFNYYKDSNNG